MTNYRMSGRGLTPIFDKSNRIIIHRKAFREVTNCRECDLPLSKSPVPYKATGLCHSCVNRLKVVCPTCGESVRVIPIKKKAHKCFETLPIRAWRACVLAGTIDKRKETI